ncbi:MAG TPA: tRNA (adenosine(37)-N6)-threonylcarbamoyltransferase complex transferase subunit TsaD [Clostridiales bacterium]|nr:tRNA (adenosine(37)-N6)-threonylcarbamoyltransferase complex transferase subunit TsaD [Clostridiales bacterium]
MKYEEIVKQKVKDIQQKVKNNQDIYVLAIESSCDETSIAVVKNGREVLSNEIASQIDIHTRFGGVVPEVASRNHILCINNVLSKSLQTAGLTLDDIDAIAVTYGAGLSGALMVGVNFAKGLALAKNLPLVAVNHIKGHISANYIQNKDLKPPFVCLVVSGGHTAILRVDDYLHHTLIGQTLDDAIGEAFDKVARVVGLGYPGGPKIDKEAKKGEYNLMFVKKSELDKTYNVSYSGLKTAVINYLHQKEQKGEVVNVADVACSFQHEAIDMLSEKVVRAAKEFHLNTVAMAGGVAANSYLREKMQTLCEQNNIDLTYPALILCTDNGAMIGAEGYNNLILNNNICYDLKLSPNPSLKLN